MFTYAKFLSEGGGATCYHCKNITISLRFSCPLVGCDCSCFYCQVVFKEKNNLTLSVVSTDEQSSGDVSVSSSSVSTSSSLDSSLNLQTTASSTATTAQANSISTQPLSSTVAKVGLSTCCDILTYVLSMVRAIVAMFFG